MLLLYFLNIDSEEAMRSVEQANKLRDVQHENHELNQLVTKMKTVSHWKQNFQRGIYARSVSMSDLIGNKQYQSGDRKGLLTVDWLKRFQVNVEVLSFSHIASLLQVSDLRRDSERSKKQYLEVKMLAEEEMILLRQQLVALRNALRDSEKECVEIRAQLEIEVPLYFYLWKKTHHFRNIQLVHD